MNMRLKKSWCISLCHWHFPHAWERQRFLNQRGFFQNENTYCCVLALAPEIFKSPFKWCLQMFSHLRYCRTKGYLHIYNTPSTHFKHVVALRNNKVHNLSLVNSDSIQWIPAPTKIVQLIWPARHLENSIFPLEVRKKEWI